MYALVKDNTVIKYPYSITDLRIDNPTIAFPKLPDDNTLASFDVVPVTLTDPPQCEYTKNPVSTIALIGDKWVQQWTLIDASEEEQAERLRNQEDGVRDMRNKKLSESDWTQVADATVDQAAWATYRQALRDIPGQEGFPWDVTWPTQPE